MRTTQLRTARTGTVDLVEVYGTLDIASTPRLRTVLLNRLADGGRHLVVDLTRADLIDCTAIGVFVYVGDHARHCGGSLRAVGAQGIVLQTMEVTGVAKCLGAYDSPEQALAALAADEAGPEPDGRTAPGGPAGPAGRTGSGGRSGSGGRTGTGKRAGSGGRAGASRAGADAGVEDSAQLLLRVMGHLPPDAPERRELRAEAIELSLPFATGLARRFRDRGEPQEDLDQVATVGLMKAVDGYDPSLGTEFASYAAPTIMGEVRRYFRDRGWRIRVPRRLQELRLSIQRAQGELTQRLGRSPNSLDLARHLGVPEQDVLAALEAASAYRPSSLSEPTRPDADTVVADRLAVEDHGIDAVDYRESLRPAIARLPRREQRILSMRFFGNMTQTQIAREIGISQMHVSRLLSASLRRLRSELTTD